jgi:hypothetical protein
MCLEDTMYTYIHTCIHTYKMTCSRLCVSMCLKGTMYTYLTYMHAYIQNDMLSTLREHVFEGHYVHIPTYMHAYIHTYTYADDMPSTLREQAMREQSFDGYGAPGGMPPHAQHLRMRGMADVSIYMFMCVYVHVYVFMEHAFACAWHG